MRTHFYLCLGLKKYFKAKYNLKSNFGGFTYNFDGQRF